jgi:predicted Holliday junction resolvase-like endonuclease
MMLFPDITWPVAFWILSIVIFVLIVVVYLAREDIRVNNNLLSLKIKSNEILSSALAESIAREHAIKKREEQLIRSFDLFVSHHEELYACMRLAPDSDARKECVRKFRDDIEFSDGMINDE